MHVRQALIDAITLSKSRHLGTLAALEAVKRAAQQNAKRGTGNRKPNTAQGKLGMEKSVSGKRRGIGA